MAYKVRAALKLVRVRVLCQNADPYSSVTSWHYLLFAFFLTSPGSNAIVAAIGCCRVQILPVSVIYSTQKRVPLPAIAGHKKTPGPGAAAPLAFPIPTVQCTVQSGFGYCNVLCYIHPIRVRLGLQTRSWWEPAALTRPQSVWLREN